MRQSRLRPAATLVLAAAVAALAASGPATATGPGAKPNRIVGLWSTQAEVRPCGTDLPTFPIRNTLLIHANGTIVESPLIPPGGVPDGTGLYQRGQALGTWVLNKKTGRYWIHLRFDNYVDNAYHGFSLVDREARVTDKGMTIRGPVTASRYAADGSLLGQLCGNAISTRL